VELTIMPERKRKPAQQLPLTPPAPEPEETPKKRLRANRRRTFDSIGEVCSMLDIKPHVLRYWETQFDELSPTKNRAGNRVYQARDIELIALIRKLVHEERYTVEGARHRLEELRTEGTSPEQSSRALERSLIRTLRAELEEVVAMLDPGAR
jgi:DNA-binding transcriptional MerR regulator